MTQEPGGGGIKVKTKKKGVTTVVLYDSRGGWSCEFKSKLIKSQSK